MRRIKYRMRISWLSISCQPMRADYCVFNYHVECDRSIRWAEKSNPSATPPVGRQVLLLFTHISGVARHTIIAWLATSSSTAPLCQPPVCSAAEAVDSDVSAALIRISRRRRWRVTAQKRLLSALVKAECSALVMLETDYCPSLCRGLVGSEPYRCHLMLAYQASAVCPLAKRWNVCCSM